MFFQKKVVHAGLALALVFSAPAAEALQGLEGLQKAALSDQATECMVHEYTRQYNEVLRDFSRKKRKWNAEMEQEAHPKAMQWVHDVWKFADQGVVQHNLQSREFRSAVENFRSYQKAQYPKLSVVR